MTAPRLSLRDADGALDLSVLIVGYNAGRTLARCLQSVADASDGMRLEVIVVDNDSTDDTAEIVASEFPWVRLIQNGSNAGFARAANTALAAAEGRALLLLNPDTVVPARTLRDALQHFNGRPEIGMLGCKLVRADGSFDHACKRGLPTVASAFYYLIGLHRLFPRSKTFAAYLAGQIDNDTPSLVEAINGAFMLVRREAVVEVGGLDERFWLYGEDLDWCARFAERGWKILYWPTVHVVHLKGATGGESGSRTWRTNVAFHRSMWLYYDKHLARSRRSPMRGLVWIGVWSRCVVTGAASGLRRTGRLVPRAR